MTRFAAGVWKAVLGETRVLPLSLAGVLLLLGLVVKPALGDAWHHAGGLLLIVGVIAVLVVSIVGDLRPGQG